MRKLIVCYCFLSCLISVSQEKTHLTNIDANFYYGTILEHNPDISHLITDHPTGLILSYNRKTFGYNDWESRYNYPDYGVSFTYQNLKNYYLGENYGLYAHFNFYFFKRKMMFRVGQGLAYTTKPYDKYDNFINNAYGSKLLSSTYIMANYKKENIWKGLGLQAGFSIIHYSNANFRAPNNSTNTFVFNVGANYSLDYKNIPEYRPSTEEKKFTEPIKYNIALRGGLNESDVVNSGQFPLFTLSFYADKRINRKSALHAGTELFLATFLKELIEYKSIAFPEESVAGDEDWKRVGLFVGHELFINKLSFITQLGYYIYYPFDFEGRVYNRIGLKRYFGESLYGAVTVKSHGAKAEGVEFGIGVRL